MGEKFPAAASRLVIWLVFLFFFFFFGKHLELFLTRIRLCWVGTASVGLGELLAG